MTLAELSLAALILAIVVSCVSQMNVGVLSLALAWIVGVYIGHMRLDDVIGTFPVQLFLMLVGSLLDQRQVMHLGEAQHAVQREG